MYWSWWLQRLIDDIYETNKNVCLDSPVEGANSFISFHLEYVVSSAGVIKKVTKYFQKIKTVCKKKKKKFSGDPMAALA